MKKLYIILFLFYGFSATAQQAKQICYTFNETSVVKDSTGFQYPYAIWQKLLQSGNYGLRAVRANDVDFEFLIYTLSDTEWIKRMDSLPKPRETTVFKTGNQFPNFKVTDIEGNKFNLKELAGKVIVLNFWFINCAPCRQEIPDLNKMVLKYKNNPNVVFLAVGLDSKWEIKDFIKKSPFTYHLTENGGYLAKFYKVNSFPTHVVIDQTAMIMAVAFPNSEFVGFDYHDKSIEQALNPAGPANAEIK